MDIFYILFTKHVTIVLIDATGYAFVTLHLCHTCYKLHMLRTTQLDT